MTTTELSLIELEIKKLLQIPGSHYFTVYHNEDIPIKIRVSDHSAKWANNGDTITYSFVANRNNQGYQAMANEWQIIDDNELLTDTYEFVKDILEWEFSQIK